MSATAQLMRTLRSRNSAIGLLGCVVVMSIGATLVPQGGPSDPQVARWASTYPQAEMLASILGLHHVFSSPVFLLVVVVLTLSTAACAVERTRIAARASGTSRRLSDGEVVRLRRRADFERVFPGRTDDRALLDEVAGVASAFGMRVRSGPRVMEAVSRRWGIWGSPLFHWSLAVLMAIFIAGYATRAEGTIDLPIDQPVRDAPDAYHSLAAGPLFGGHTGLQINAEDLAQSLVIDGVERGPAPFVSLTRGDTVVKAQRIYPNNPLRYGSLTAHIEGLALALAVSVEDSRGVAIGRVPFTVHYSLEESGTAEPAELTLVDARQMPIMDVRFAVQFSSNAGDRAAQVPDLIPAIVETSTPGSGAWGRPVTLRLGESIELPGASGEWMRFVSLDDAVIVRVANDWSVPFIYALFALAVLGLSAALLVLPRRVVAVVEEAADGTVLRMLVDAGRDPVFRRDLLESASSALDALPQAARRRPPDD
jgi:cytochrome c biogenesis protein ResB